VWFVPNDIFTSPLQGLGLAMICLWLNLLNYHNKVLNPIIYDRRKIQNDRKSSKVIFSCLISVYKRTKRGLDTTYFEEKDFGRERMRLFHKTS
jgi:uncharacterized protein with PIN domain